MTNETNPETVDVAQLRVVLQLLEMNHGRVLRYGDADEARAYYDAITLVEDAIGGEFDPTKLDTIDDGMMDDCIQESRDARDEGWRAATKAEERFDDDRRPAYATRPSLLDRLRSALP